MKAKTKKRHASSTFGGPDVLSFIKKNRPDLYARYKNPSPKMRLALNLCKLRSNLGLTQTQLSRLAGVSTTTYRGIEEAQPVSNPKLDVIVKLSTALNVEVQDLWKSVTLA